MATILRGGYLIDGTGTDPAADVSVVMDKGTITEVGGVDAIKPGVDDTVVDVEGRTLMPGLIDAHTHLGYHVRQPDVWTQELKESIELNTLYAAANATAILHCGFTAIGDGGCRGFISSAVRDAIATGVIEGPRIRAAGAIICGEAGLLDNTPPWSETRTHASLGMTVMGADEVRRAVRRQVKGGVDWIKVAASGVAGSRWSSADTDDLGYEELRAAVVEAAKFGLPVHAHAHSIGGIRAAVKAGVISLHCGEYADRAAIEEMRGAGIYFSPTIAWLHVRCMPRFGAPTDPEFRAEAWAAFEAARRMVPEAQRLGATIAVGTDAAHRFPHVPDGVLEMEYFVALGYTPMQAIVAGTSSAAKAIGCGDQLGQLKAGYAADILMVDGNPARDISLLRNKRNIVRMWKGGVEVGLAPDRGPVGVQFIPSDWIGHNLELLSAA
jgi:imidazolonepropionase-like amidohydrolase